jgi:hypothetical protein
MINKKTLYIRNIIICLLSIVEGIFSVLDSLIRLLLFPISFTEKGQYGFNTGLRKIANWACSKEYEIFFNIEKNKKH